MHRRATDTFQITGSSTRKIGSGDDLWGKLNLHRYV